VRGFRFLRLEFEIYLGFGIFQMVSLLYVIHVYHNDVLSAIEPKARETIFKTEPEERGGSGLQSRLAMNVDARWTQQVDVCRRRIV
jgi:hypothetical protein